MVGAPKDRPPTECAPCSVEQVKARAVSVSNISATCGKCPAAFLAMWAGCLAISGKQIATRVSESQSITSLFVPLGFWILPTPSNLMTLRSAMEKSFIAGACERSGLKFWSLSHVLLIPTRELVSVWSSCPGRATAFPQELGNVQSLQGRMCHGWNGQRLPERPTQGSHNCLKSLYRCNWTLVQIVPQDQLW